MLAKYVVDKIVEYWSPEQIANSWKEAEKEFLSHETIYKYKSELVKIYFRRRGTASPVKTIFFL